MKKLFSILAFLLIFSSISFAQTAVETTFKINKVDQPAYMIELNYPPDVVEAALKKQLKESVDEKGSESKNIRAYKGINFSQISSDKIDVYTSVERKGKKEKDASRVYLLVSKGYDQFVSSSSDAKIAQNAKDFLNNFMSTAAVYNNGVQIKDQEEVVKKAQKKLDNTKGDIADYQKKIADLQKKIADTQKDQANQETILSNESKRLEDLKAQNH